MKIAIYCVNPCCHWFISIKNKCHGEAFHLKSIINTFIAAFGLLLIAVYIVCSVCLKSEPLTPLDEFQSVVKYFSWNGFWNVNNYTGSFEISERDMYPIHALPTCIHALDVCVKDPSCLRLYGDFRDHCKTRTGSCRDRYVSNDHPSPTIFSCSSRNSIRV